MRSKLFLIHILNLTLSIGCLKPKDDDDDKKADEDSDYDHSQEVGELSDTKLETIKEFLTDSKYSDWTATALHDETLNSPHGAVRTFFNDSIKTSIEEGNDTHPVGSITIKEIYNGKTLRGYAANIKIEKGSGKNTWLFYEGFSPDYDDIYGIGHSSCTSCHSSGTDFVREPLP